MSWQKVEIRTNEYMSPDGSTREVDQVELWGYGQTLRRDVHAPLDVLMAEKLAASLDVPFIDWRNQE